MPALVLALIQALLLLLLYWFVARAVRWVVRDVRGAGAVVEQVPAGRLSRARTVPHELVVHPPGGRPQVLALRRGEFVFGRSAAVTVPLDDPFVSESHARVYRDGDEWLVDDMGSTNGTFLNQVKVTDPTPIVAGDRIELGKTVVEVRR